MKLFSIKVTVDGKKAELAGYDKNESFEMPNTLEAPATYNPIKLSIGDEIGNFKVIGPLSEVTEEMARQCGYKSEYHMTWDVIKKLNEAGIPDADQDFSKILVILIKDE